MADIHSKETRSFNMSRIRSKDTKPEMLVRKFLFAKGFRYRLHDKKLPGKPDIVLTKYKAVIFVNGCFWHGHTNCHYSKLPKTRIEWWKNKINNNVVNDNKVRHQLIEQNWQILDVWTCQLKASTVSETLNNIIKSLNMT
jgi:DNA mismatch endonuclease (patch repair protein)